MSANDDAAAGGGAGSRRLLVIHNPTAGGGHRRLAATLRGLERRGCRAVVRETRASGHGGEIAAAGTRDRFDAVVVAGGDGTVNEVANALAGGDVPMGIVPLGTANVLAGELGLPTAPAGVAEVIAAGRTRTIHLGEVDGRRFCMMAGIGHDGRVVRDVDMRLKRRVGKLAYALASAADWWRNPPRVYDIDLDGRRTTAAWIIVANGRHYAGRFVAAPSADVAAPRLDVCLFRRPGRWNLVRYGVALLRGRAERLPDVDVVAARELVVAGPAGEPVQADGELVAALPVRIRVAAARLRVLAPT